MPAALTLVATTLGTLSIRILLARGGGVENSALMIAAISTIMPGVSHNFNLQSIWLEQNLNGVVVIVSLQAFPLSSCAAKIHTTGNRQC